MNYFCKCSLSVRQDMVVMRNTKQTKVVSALKNLTTNEGTFFQNQKQAKQKTFKTLINLKQ